MEEKGYQIKYRDPVLVIEFPSAPMFSKFVEAMKEALALIKKEREDTKMFFAQTVENEKQKTWKFVCIFNF